MPVLLLNLLLLGGLSWWGFRHWRSSPVAAYYWPALLLKLLCGLGVLALYRYYYQYGDILWFQADAAQTARLFWQDPAAFFASMSDIGLLHGPHPYMGFDRTLFHLRILSLPALLSGGNGWLMSAWLAFGTFMGTFWLVHRLALQYRGSGLAAAVAFLFWPSVVFWTSSLLKEAPAMAATAVLVAAALPLISGKGSNTLFQWVLMLLAAWLLWRLKYYFAIPLFGVLLLLSLLCYLQQRGVTLRKRALWLLAGVLLVGGLLSQLHPNLHPGQILEVLAYNYRAIVALSEPGRYLQFEALKPTLGSMLSYSPKALAGGLLMPLPFLPPRFELFQLLAGLENLLLLGLLVAAYVKLYRSRLVRIPPQVVGLCLYVGLLAVAMAMASPNFGSLLRYRTAYLPFLVFLLLYWLFGPRKGRGLAP
jgi:hypothetical protein